jgi:3'-phosphoadenosine 5'-phosphosulfate sulfotransferase (PAPS reductase)/FAD synthetase
MITNEELKRRQSLSLDDKIKWSLERINEFYDVFDGLVYVSFSGGKDSTVLLRLVRSIFPDVEGVFADTGLEYPEIRDFVKTFDNVTWVKPKISFNKVIEKYGYPVISKEQSRYINDCQNPTPNNIITRQRRLTGINSKGEQTKSGMISKKWLKMIDAPFKISEKCCDVMKKSPMYKFTKDTGKHPIVGSMIVESSLRKQSYIKLGCNAFESKHPQSRPLSIWLEKDIWEYIRINNLQYSKIYDTGVKRTGCMFCMFGVQFEKSDMFNKNRFQLMKETHPKQWNYCINKLGCGKVLDFIGVEYE